jgi:hypothetical protein
MTSRSISIPPANDSASAPSSAPPSGSPACIRAHATKVLNIASSPWAKLTMPVDR